MTKFDFPTLPDPTARDVQRSVLDLLPQLERVIIRNVLVKTTETTQVHGLRGAPTFYSIKPKGDARVWESRDPDATRIYLKASSQVYVDVEVVR